MNILVTGGAGFIGSHVVDAYVAAGHRVTVVDDLSRGQRERLNPKARFVRADVGSPALRALFRRGKFQAVNHHAAQIDVRRSVEDPAFDARVNLLGLLNLLELSRRHGVRRFIFAASGGTYYGECGRRPARESDRPSPLSPYGITKLSSEFYLRAYAALHGLRYAVLRYANVYGPRQDPHGEAGVVAIFCQRMLRGEPVVLYGRGAPLRDYVYAGDVARANVLALKRGTNDAVNVGTRRATSVRELFDILAREIGYDREPVLKPLRPGELKRSCLDIAYARRRLGWAPLTSLEKGLAETADYFRRTDRGR